MRKYKSPYTLNKTLHFVIIDQQKEIEKLKLKIRELEEFIEIQKLTETAYDFLMGISDFEIEEKEEDPFYEYSTEGDTSQDLNH